MAESSEFGRGLTYCLGLFLCHSEREYGQEKSSYRRDAGMWFNAASDHLYDLEIPESLPVPLRSRLEAFRDLSLKWGHGYEPLAQATDKDKEWAIQEAKDLLREIDVAFGVPSEKAGWE